MNVLEVSPGVYRGRSPRTAEDYQRLKQLGIKTVLNLRRRDTAAIAAERTKLASMGVDMVHVPMRYFPRGDGAIDRAVRVVNDSSLYPMYVHCKEGKDRCGTVIGVYRVRHHGWDHGAAYAEMLKHGFDSRLFGLRRSFYRGG